MHFWLDRSTLPISPIEVVLFNKFLTIGIKLIRIKLKFVCKVKNYNCNKNTKTVKKAASP